MTNHLSVRPMLGDLTTSREDKALAKHLRSLQLGASLELAHVQAAEVVACAKVEALQATGHVALASAAALAAHRRSLAEHDPTAVGCLDHVTEPVIRAMARQVEQLDRRLS